MNLSFAGCGFLGIYHIGVVSCFRQYAQHLVHHLSGASAGAMAACAFICDCPLGQITSDTLKVSIDARRYPLGPFHPNFDVTGLIQEHMKEILPEDAHSRCSGRLRISVTRVSDGKNVILDQFNTKDELIQALQCSSFIPLFSGIIPPTFRGIRYIDGCYSDNLPIYDENTVTISPFCGQSDICPRDNSFILLHMNLANTSIDLSTQNIYRFMRVLFPPHPEILSQMCKRGFEDALRFLQKNDLISCARCVAINSTLQFKETSDHTAVPLSSDDEDSSGDEDNCIECKRQKQRALLNDLPEAVLTVFEEACASVNNGLLNWIFKHKSMRILSVLTLPYVLPIDIGFVVLSRFMELAPKLKRELTKIIESLVEYARNILSTFNKRRHLYSAKFTCKLAITEYDYDADDGYPPKRPVSPQFCRRHGSATVFTLTDEVSAPVTNKHISLSDSRVLGTMNFDFQVDLQSTPMSPSSSATSAPIGRPLVTAHGADWQEETVIDIANAALHWDSRRAEVWDSQVDTFDDILEVTRRQEALMAYYYLDDKNRLKVTEIFNVVDADTSAVSSIPERENNHQRTWDEESWLQAVRGDRTWTSIPSKTIKVSSSKDSLLDGSIDSTDEIFNCSLLTDDNERIQLDDESVKSKARGQSVVIIDS